MFFGGGFLWCAALVREMALVTGKKLRLDIGSKSFHSPHLWFPHSFSACNAKTGKGGSATEA